MGITREQINAISHKVIDENKTNDTMYFKVHFSEMDGNILTNDSRFILLDGWYTPFELKLIYEMTYMIKEKSRDAN